MSWIEEYIDHLNTVANTDPNHPNKPSDHSPGNENNQQISKNDGSRITILEYA